MLIANFLLQVFISVLMWTEGHFFGSGGFCYIFANFLGNIAGILIGWLPQVDFLISRIKSDLWNLFRLLALFRTRVGVIGRSGIRLYLILGSYGTLLVSIVHYLQHDALLELLFLKQLLLFSTLVLLHQMPDFHFEIFLSIIIRVCHFQIIQPRQKHDNTIKCRVYTKLQFLQFLFDIFGSTRQIIT